MILCGIHRVSLVTCHLLLKNQRFFHERYLNFHRGIFSAVCRETDIDPDHRGAVLVVSAERDRGVLSQGVAIPKNARGGICRAGIVPVHLCRLGIFVHHANPADVFKVYQQFARHPRKIGHVTGLYHERAGTVRGRIMAAEPCECVFIGRIIRHGFFQRTWHGDHLHHIHVHRTKQLFQQIGGDFPAESKIQKNALYRFQHRSKHEAIHVRQDGDQRVAGRPVISVAVVFGGRIRGRLGVRGVLDELYPDIWHDRRNRVADFVFLAGRGFLAFAHIGRHRIDHVEYIDQQSVGTALDRQDIKSVDTCHTDQLGFLGNDMGRRRNVFFRAVISGNICYHGTVRQHAMDRGLAVIQWRDSKQRR